MIIYDLECMAGHRFQGWFASSDSYKKQQQAGLVQCSICGIGQTERITSDSSQIAPIMDDSNYTFIPDLGHETEH